MKFLKKYGVKIITWLIFVATIISIYIRFFQLKDGFNFQDIHYHSSRLWSIFIVLILMFINWSLEGLKWKKATQYLQPVSFISASKGVLMGTSVSLLFPNRTFEFLGKILILKAENRFKGIFASMLTSLAQLFITLLFGSLGLYFCDISIPYVYNYHQLVSIVLTVMIISFYFLLPMITQYVESFLSKKIISFIAFLKSYRQRDLIIIVGLSLVRYIVFVIQLYLLFWLFTQKLNFFSFLHIAFVSFLLTTIIPTTSLSELFVRNQVGLMLFNGIVPSDETIVAVFTLLWLINIGIPAMIGLFISFTIKN